ncbi:MAG: helix-turn-helix domain-containing protein [Micropruina sp.]|nr:MAG: helix-turn-helix domain-containing protein [Micropruina sp.]
MIRRRRLHDASERLRAGERTLADLATELGYADQTHFTKDYRRATGANPGAFAARSR